MSHLDYINAIFSTLLASTIRPLTSTQNLAAKQVLNSRDKDMSSLMLNKYFIGYPLKTGQYTNVLPSYTLVCMELDQV